MTYLTYYQTLIAAILLTNLGMLIGHIIALIKGREMITV